MSTKKSNAFATTTKEPAGMVPDEMVDTADPAAAMSPSRPAIAQPIDTGEMYCPVHNCKMISSGSKPSATLYRCRVRGCEHKGAKLRPNVPSPTEPMWCPECAGGPVKKDVACIVNRRMSGGIQLHMECPVCFWSVKVPLPDAANRVERLPRSDKTILGSVQTNIF